MSSPEHDPKQTTSTPDGALPPGGGEVINVRRGMFGVTDTGDTSGYGRLVREVILPGSSPWPYGGYFDAAAIFG
jgi:NADH-quinone oxidoreductase subunit C